MTQASSPGQTPSPSVESPPLAAPAPNAALFAELMAIARRHPSASGATLLIGVVMGLGVVAVWTRGLGSDHLGSLITLVVIAGTLVSIVGLRGWWRVVLNLVALLAFGVWVVSVTRREWFSPAPEPHDAGHPSDVSKPEPPAVSTPSPPHAQESAGGACPAAQHWTGNACERDLPPQPMSARASRHAICSGAVLKVCPQVECIEKESGQPYMFGCLCGKDVRRFDARGRDFVQARRVLLQTGDVPDCSGARGDNP